MELTCQGSEAILFYLRSALLKKFLLIYEEQMGDEAATKVWMEKTQYGAELDNFLTKHLENLQFLTKEKLNQMQDDYNQLFRIKRQPHTTSQATKELFNRLSQTCKEIYSASRLELNTSPLL